MAPRPRPQRIRDPLHNLIEFGSDEFEHCLWNVIQTRPFQRLRRIKQLGFSEFVYPGATHTRFAHCVGVFHTARLLMQIIEQHIKEQKTQFSPHQAMLALTGALVHDLGHGMFSHSFETVGKQLGLKYARHEHVSDAFIRSDEVKDALRPLGGSFADEVAALIQRQGPLSLYDAVVSSQFDADRLDYMQRDRMMTGVQNGGIDFTWLRANLEVGTLPRGVDEDKVDDIETFVLGPKAIHAAETFVLTLFQLYPNVYFHKATRGAEKVFAELMLSIISLAREKHVDKTGLPANHPFIKFAYSPDSLDNVLELDDTVFWGALPLLVDAPDRGICELATMLRDRKLPKSFDVRACLQERAKVPTSKEEREVLELKLDRVCAKIIERATEWSNQNKKTATRIFSDREERHPYKRFQESKGQLNQIRIKRGGQILDVADCSQVVASLETYKLCRLYAAAGDSDALEAIQKIVTDTWDSDHDQK